MIVWEALSELSGFNRPSHGLAAPNVPIGNPLAKIHPVTNHSLLFLTYSSAASHAQPKFNTRGVSWYGARADAALCSDSNSNTGVVRVARSVFEDRYDV